VLIKNGDGSVMCLRGHCDGVGDVIEAGSGAVVPGYSKLLRARRLRPKARNTRI
jgi:hypothetical protein